MKNILITDKQLQYIRESQILSEAKVLTDNFDDIAKLLLTFNSPDDFYYVQIMKRLKDNPNDSKSSGNYHAGAWYLGGMRIHSAQELINQKNAITSICDANNARAYITINTRSDAATDAQIGVYKKKYSATDARNIYADQIIPSQPKEDLTKFPNRTRYFADVDEPELAYEITQRVNFKRTGKKPHMDLVDIDVNGKIIKGRLSHSSKPALVAYPKNAQEDAYLRQNVQGFNIWEKTRELFQKNNTTIEMEKISPSGGLHILANNYGKPEFGTLKQDLINIIDRGVDLDRLATVHLNIDGKFILYSNVNTPGY